MEIFEENDNRKNVASLNVLAAEPDRINYGTQRKKSCVPLWQRSLLTLNEAAEYTGLGQQKLREISNSEDCGFVLWVGTKRMLKRAKLDEYLNRVYSI